MNLDICVDWANKIIAFRENMPHNIQALHVQKKGFARSFRGVFGWIDRFIEPIRRWSSTLELISIARDEVKSNGLRIDTADRFKQRIQEVSGDNQSPTERILINKLHAFLSQQSQAIPVGQKFLGTSDIIESVFAKYKNFSARTPMKGVGKTVLTIPVFLSQITPETVSVALKNCPNKNVTQWINSNIGQSVFAQRAKALAN